MSMPSEASQTPANPLDPAVSLHHSPPSPTTQNAHPQAIPLETDSAVTKAEKYERHPNASVPESYKPSFKRIKLDVEPDIITPASGERQKGTVSIKAEYSSCQTSRLRKSAN